MRPKESASELEARQLLAGRLLLEGYWTAANRLPTRGFLPLLDSTDLTALVGSAGWERMGSARGRTAPSRSSDEDGTFVNRDYSVRREEGVGFSWVQVPPGSWSLQPEAVGAAVEVTKLSKPSMTKGRLYDNALETVTGTLSAAKFKALNAGKHTIYVHGKDAAGNWVGSPRRSPRRCRPE